MSDLRRVPLRSSRTDRYVGRLIVGVAVAILIAVVKPWGGDNGRQPVAAAAVATPTPTPTPTPSPTPGPKSYDFLAWGTNEPPPGWELWPAGRLSSFSFAMRIDVAPQAIPSAVGSAQVSVSPSDTGLAARSPVEASAAPAIPETWPKVEIPAGSSLELVAVNHPREYDVQIVGVSRLNTDGTSVAVHAITGPSPWPTHFTIVGLGSGVGPGGMEPWPSGRYRLDIQIMPGAVDRSIEIVVEPGPVGSAARSSAP